MPRAPRCGPRSPSSRLTSCCFFRPGCAPSRMCCGRRRRSTDFTRPIRRCVALAPTPNPEPNRHA
eukprot:3194634-Prymnesium_polylepis.2